MTTMPAMRCLILSSAILVAACSGPRQSKPDDAAILQTSSAEQSAATARQWLGDLQAISAQADSDGRRHAIEQRLQAEGLVASTLPFSAKELTGTNVLADVSGPADAPLLLIGAHLDQVAKGNGVTDNAAGSGVVLALAQRFRDQPLTHHRVAVAFWDLEERGLLGAKAYVEQKSPKPALYVNVDVFGWGETLWMMTPDDAHPLVVASKNATDSVGIHFAGGPNYPPSDHLAFIEAGWPAVSYSLVGKDEIAPILQVFAKQKPTAMPKVMTVIHSDNDTMDQVDAKAAAKGIDALEQALRRWDAQAAAGG